MTCKDFELVAKRLGVSLAMRLTVAGVKVGTERYTVGGVAMDVAAGLAMAYPRFQKDLFVATVMVAYEAELLGYEDCDG